MREKRRNNVRRNCEESLRACPLHPSHPVIGSTFAGNTIFKEPIITGVCEMSIRIVRSDCIPTPAGNSDTEMFDVIGAGREIDAIDERINDRSRAKGDAEARQKRG